MTDVLHQRSMIFNYSKFVVLGLAAGFGMRFTGPTGILLLIVVNCFLSFWMAKYYGEAVYGLGAVFGCATVFASFFGHFIQLWQEDHLAIPFVFTLAIVFSLIGSRVGRFVYARK